MMKSTAQRIQEKLKELEITSLQVKSMMWPRYISKHRETEDELYMLYNKWYDEETARIAFLKTEKEKEYKKIKERRIDHDKKHNWKKN